MSSIQQAQRPRSAGRGGSELTGQAGPRQERLAEPGSEPEPGLILPGPRARTRSQSRTWFFTAMGAGARGATREAQASGTEPRGWGPREQRPAHTAGSVQPQLPAARVRPRPSCAPCPCAPTSPSPARAPADGRSWGSDLPCERGVFLGPPLSPTQEHAQSSRFRRMSYGSFLPIFTVFHRQRRRPTAPLSQSSGNADRARQAVSSSTSPRKLPSQPYERFQADKAPDDAGHLSKRGLSTSSSRPRCCSSRLRRKSWRQSGTQLGAGSSPPCGENGTPTSSRPCYRALLSPEEKVCLSGTQRWVRSVRGLIPGGSGA